MNYQEYLTKHKYSPSSIKGYVLQSEKFIQWLTKQGYTLQHFDYKQALHYVAYLQDKHSNIKTINHKIIGVKHYFEYLIDRSRSAENPFTTITIKGEKRNKMRNNLLSVDELEDLYYSYPTDQDKRINRILANKRNKVIVGLLVYQGLSTSDIKRLQLEHVKLNQGKIYIPKGRIGNRRELHLKPWQIMEMMEYINQIRPQLQLRKQQTSSPLRGPACRQGRDAVGRGDLFASTNRLSDTIGWILKKLKHINHKVENTHQLRASVIVNWLSNYNLREVQVMAGHKYISTTEKYLQEDLKQLQEIINLHHPLQ
jgi:integrase/recombinase XerD